MLGFSFKAILIKLAYAWHPVDAVTLLALRMLFSAPFFVAMAWWAGRRPDARPIARRDWLQLAWLGFIGYYLASLLDFMGLAYITAALERLVLFLYPTMVVVLSARAAQAGRSRGAQLMALVDLVRAASRSSSRNDLSSRGDRMRATLTGGALVFGSALAYALYLVDAGAVIARLGSLRFIAWAMLVSCVFVLAHFALTRDARVARACRRRSMRCALAMAVFSTVLPTWLIAEAIHRLGASTSSLIGSLGPVFTIGLGCAHPGRGGAGDSARRRGARARRRHAGDAAARGKRDGAAAPIVQMPDT